MSDPIRIGIVGLNFGMHLIRSLANVPDARLVAFADRSCAQSKFDSVVAKYASNGYRDAMGMLHRELLDAVLICTAPASRESLMRAAIERDIAIWVEKPWASDFAHAQLLHDLASRSKKPVMCGFSFRFHPAVQKLIELIRGDLGRPWMINAQYVFDWWPKADWWLWKPDGGNGFFNENSGHLIDLVCALAGEPEYVYAETSRCGDSPGDNAASITIRFDTGTTATLTLGGVGSKAFQDYPRLTAYTQNGQAELIGEQHTWRELRWSFRQANEVQSLLTLPESLANTRYTHALSHFLACVRDNRSPAATPTDGVRTVAVADAIRESARTGKRVIVQRLPSERT